MWRYVKVAIVIALLAFLLPWMSASLLGREVVAAAGWQLAFGQFHGGIGSVSIDAHAFTNYYFIVALALIAVSLILSLLRRRFAGVVIATSLLAMAFVWAGSNQYTGDRIEAAASKVGGILGSLAASAVEIDWRVGYWVALLALGVAAALALLAIGGGAAGIAAARRLHEARADVLLVEASSRIGGRAHSIRVRGEVLDLGCAWLHSADRNPWTRIALAEGFQIDRTDPHWREQWHNLGFAPGEPAAPGPPPADWHQRAAAYATGPDRPLSDFIAADSPWRPMIDAISGYANGANLRDVSLHDWAAYEDAACDDNWRLQEGYGTLIAAYARPLPVRLDTPVSLVDHRGRTVRLTTPAGILEADRQ